MHIDNIKKKYVSKLSLNDILCLYGYTYIKEDAREWTIKDLNHPTLEKINQFSNKYIKEDATSKKFFSLVSNQEMTKFNSINKRDFQYKIIRILSNEFNQVKNDLRNLRFLETDIICTGEYEIQNADKFISKLFNYGELLKK